MDCLKSSLEGKGESSCQLRKSRAVAEGRRDRWSRRVYSYLFMTGAGKSGLTGTYLRDRGETSNYTGAP
jgi:hypothetical protein